VEMLTLEIEAEHADNESVHAETSLLQPRLVVRDSSIVRA